MLLIKCFLVGGIICAISQIIMDKFKLIPIYITSFLVIIGSVLTIKGIYPKLIEYSGFGAGLPISSFGSSLTLAAIEKSKEVGYFGIFTGMFDKTSPGIIFVIVISFIIALVKKPKG